MLLAQATGRALTTEALQAPYRACRDRWVSQGVNLAAYTTAASAADVNDLWRTLGYKEVNLYGVSYGTVLAQTVMRDDPDGLRSVVLDSAYPLPISLFADMAANVSGMLTRVFAECAADLLCRTVYPDLESVYHNLLDELNRAPVRLTATHPATGEPFTFDFDGAEFFNVIQSLSPRLIPATIYDLRDGEYSAALTLRKADIGNALLYGPPPSRAMAYSVMCSQGMYSATPEQMSATAAYPESAWANRFIYRDLVPVPCGEWPARRDPADQRPWTSDIPTLVLSGEYDPTRAAGYDQMLAATLRRGVVVAVPNTGHGVLISSGLCTNGLALAFVHDPSRGPDTRCVASVNRPILDATFAVRAAVTRRPALILAGAMGLVVAWSLARAGRYAFTHPGAFSGRPALRAASWIPAAIGAGLVGLAFLRGQEQFMWVDLPRVLGTLLVPIAALQAALLFSPEDEPALEVALASPRPLAWTVLERLAVMFAWQGGAAVVLSLIAVNVTGESLTQIILRWLPPLLFFTSAALCLTFITRRAVFSVVIISLLWFTLNLLGDAIVERWPFAWPLSPYLRPNHVEYALNRWFVALAGLSLLVWAMTMLRDEERLLLGDKKAKRTRRDTPNPNTQAPMAGTDLPPSTPPLPLALHQFSAMLRYEFLLQWRRRALSVIMLALIALPVLAAVIFGRQALAGVAVSGLTPARARELVMQQMVPAVWMTLWLFLTLLVPVVVAETIPKDKHYGVRELLDSLPLSPGLYLAGKLVSMWAAVFAGLALGMVVIGAVWGLAVGPFDLRWYANVWLAGAAPMAFINPGLSLLLAAGQPTGRRALLVGIGFAVVCVLLQVPGFLMLGSAWNILNPSHPVLFLYFLGTPNASPSDDPLTLFLSHYITPEAVTWTVVAGLAQVLILWAVVWAWMRWKESQA
jgi:pimeloyl-ACP methyl ester carboxylesterase